GPTSCRRGRQAPHPDRTNLCRFSSWFLSPAGLAGLSSRMAGISAMSVSRLLRAAHTWRIYTVSPDRGVSAGTSRHGEGMSEGSGIGAAVIGTGFIGTVHVEQLRRIGVQVRGVLGSTPERGQARAAALGVPRAYASLEALLADDSVDVVHVTSPNHLHLPHAQAVLAAGRHVVCEKPLGLTAAESGELLAQAAASGLVNAVNFNIRFYPLNQHARDLVASGALGAVRFVTGHYFQDWLLLDTDWNWRLEPEKGGPLRAVGDIGSHWLDLMTFATGQRITAVMADMATFITIRQEPRGPIETFATERSSDTQAR